MKKIIVLSVVAFVQAVGFSSTRFSPVGISIENKDGMQYPSERENVYGLRLGLIGGNNRVIGLSTMVLGNDDRRARGYVGGLHIASVLNAAWSGEFGVWQISGFHNSLEDGGNGIQICTFCNLTDGYFNGLQVALYNDVGKEMTGLQIGLVNRAKSLAGIQIGVLNFVSSSMMDSFPIIRIGWGG